MWHRVLCILPAPGSTPLRPLWRVCRESHALLHEGPSFHFGHAMDARERLGYAGVDLGSSYARGRSVCMARQRVCKQVREGAVYAYLNRTGPACVDRLRPPGLYGMVRHLHASAHISSHRPLQSPFPIHRAMCPTCSCSLQHIVKCRTSFLIQSSSPPQTLTSSDHLPYPFL